MAERNGATDAGVERAMTHRPRTVFGTLAAFAVVGAVACYDGVVEQVEDPTPAVSAMTAAAAGHSYDRLIEVHPEFRDRDVILDPGYPVRGGSVDHDPDMIEHVARVLNARVAPKDELVHCADGSGSCRIEDRALLIQLFEPSVDGTDGRVGVSVTYELPDLPPMRVYISFQELLLERVDGEWVVVGIGTQAAN